MAAQSDRGVLYSTLCPKFLHTNSTSHTSPFSAIAELIDNAYDPDVNAKQFWIDKTMVKGQECLSFMDNGNGLVHETMHKMLSFGYSDKTPINGVAPIGIYGNGFKSGSMRLGKDAIVFSKSERTSCVGMLSQTYLAEIGANQIVVPIVCFDHTTSRKLSVQEEQKVSLQDILRYSPFTTEEELLTELGHIGPSWSSEKTGTRIIIWNLRKTSTGQLEYDFVKDRYDIRVPSDVYEGLSDAQNPGTVSSYIPESVYSLQAYCRILYLKPRMQIIIRGQKVQTKLITKSLAMCRKDHYNPRFWPTRVPIHFGYNTISKDQYGIMMYHKNRLIKAYERVGCQIKANRQGVGVIGVIECNFLDPTHNKQSFNETDKYRNTMISLGVKLEEYWKEIQYRSNKDNPNGNTSVEDTKKRPDQNWVQCDTCLKWRKLPDGIDCSKLPDKWFCHMNPDPQFRSCDVVAELEDSDDDQPSYCKTYKQQEKQKRQQEMKKQKQQEAQQQQQIQRLLKQQEQLRQQLHQTTSTPTTPRHRINIKSPPGSAVRASSSSLSSSTISQAACSPSSSSLLPVISDVRSLSSLCSPSGKRTHPVTPQEAPKRSRVNDFSRGNSDVSSSVNLSPLCSPSVPVDEDDSGDTDDTDDDIFILEKSSTSKPKQLCFTSTKMKDGLGDANECIVLECSDEMEIPPEKNAAGTSSTSCDTVGVGPPILQTSITTQTEAPKIMKKEEEDQSQTKENVKAELSPVDVGVGTTDQRVIKQECVKDTVKCEHSEEHQEERVLQNGVTHHMGSDEAAGPSSAGAREREHPPPHPSTSAEAHKKLVEVMQTTAQERDRLKEKVNQLTCQLQEMQSRVRELSQTNVKKECSHQACQTEKREDTEDGKDYKCLFLKAKDKVDELIKDKLADAEARKSRDQAEKKEADERALQVDTLMRELDQRTQEKDELRSQLDSVKEERANLSAQCDELRLRLQQQRDEAGRAAVCSSNSSSDTFRSLIELRQNVGRLLVTFVPALDPGQLNFQCNVIDEMLEQVLSDDDFLRNVQPIQ